MALQSSENGSWLDAFVDSGSTESTEQPALLEEALRLAVANLISATSLAAATTTSTGKLCLIGPGSPLFWVWTNYSL